MMSRSERLERLVGEELGECYDGGVEARVATLKGYSTDAVAADRDQAALRVLGDETRYTITRPMASKTLSPMAVGRWSNPGSPTSTVGETSSRSGSSAAFSGRTWRT